MTLATLKTKKDALKARGVDVDALQASDLYRPGLDAETKDALRLDLCRRHSERRAAELAAK